MWQQQCRWLCAGGLLVVAGALLLAGGPAGGAAWVLGARLAAVAGWLLSRRLWVAGARAGLGRQGTSRGTGCWKDGGEQCVLA